MKTASRVTRDTSVSNPSISSNGIPRLDDGDHLTVKEFLRRYNAMTNVKKAELIEGVVHMPSAVSLRHSTPDGRLITWLGYYEAFTPGTEMLPNTTVILDLGENCPQPDSCLRIAPEHGGQSRTSPDEYVAGAPELGAEVSATTASYDLHDKLLAYQRNGIQEYIVWCVEARSIDWFVLRDSIFRRMVQRGGLFKSRVFPGLWLDAAAMLRGDMRKVLKVLQQGIDSDAHRRFVARLARRKAATKDR